MSTSTSQSSREVADAGHRPPPRARLLAAAADLFYRHGIRAVGVDAIAEAAGTNKMTLYRHFASKDELVAECLREVARRFDAVWEDIARAHAGDPEAQLLAWVGFVSDFFIAEAERGCALANAAIELPERDHPARLVIEAVKTAQRDKLAVLCRAAGYRAPDDLADELGLLIEGARVSLQSIGIKGPASRLGSMLLAIIDYHARH